MEKEMKKKKEEGGMKGEKDNNEEALTAVHVILQLVKSRPDSAVNCIGLLMNACLDSSTNNTATPTSPSPSSSPSSSSSSSSPHSSSSHTEPSPVSVRGAVAAAGGAALGLTGVHMTPHQRAHFFNFEAPEGNRSFNNYGQTFVLFKQKAFRVSLHRYPSLLSLLLLLSFSSFLSPSHHSPSSCSIFLLSSYHCHYWSKVLERDRTYHNIYCSFNVWIYDCLLLLSSAATE